MKYIGLISLFIVVCILPLSSKVSMVEMHEKNSSMITPATGDNTNYLFEATLIDNTNAVCEIPVIYYSSTKNSNLKLSTNKSKLLKHKTSGKSTDSIHVLQNCNGYRSVSRILPYFLTLSWLKRLNI
jgi:hypothetical protein